MNHYETLGVDKTATPDEIKKAYRKLASLHHPDKGGETHKFQEIQVANEILSDSNKRQQYDMELAGGGHRQFHFHSSSGMGPDDMSGGGAGDLFEHLRRQFGFGFSGSPDPFGQFRQANQQRQAPRNRDVRIAIQLDLVDNLTELTKTLNITLPGNMKENIEIKIPKGVHTGSTIRYAGLGDHSVPNAPRADLYVQFHLRQHERFEQHGIDLVTTLNINCLEAVVGCSKSVKGIDGSEFMVNIPAGTQYGAKFGIPDQGLYTTDHPGRGRLVVLVDIYVPKELTAEQIETIRAIQSTL